MDNDRNPQENTDIIVEHVTSTEGHFTINSAKAAEILGVNRTRLSQLTSKGLFPYERRKVESRSRLFYRLNDLLSYQRKSSFGNLSAGSSSHAQQSKALVPMLPAENADSSIQIQKCPVPTHHLAKARPQKTVVRTRKLKTALEAKTAHLAKDQIKRLTQKVGLLEKKLNQTVDLLQQIQNSLVNHETHKLRIKKTMLQRPRIKRTFKFIK